MSDNERPYSQQQMQYIQQQMQHILRNCPPGTFIEEEYQYYVDHCEENNIKPYKFEDWLHLMKKRD